jgi:hypothetical protein
MLFDFCFGLPCRFWDYGVDRKVSKPRVADYLRGLASQSEKNPAADL